MTKFITLFKITLLLFLTSCTTGKSIVSNSANLNKYNYASLIDIMNYNSSASLMDLEVRIYDALENTRLNLIGDQRISELSHSQKESLLLVRFSASQSESESIISVNFVDYMTGKPIASCKGSSGTGIDKNMDLENALKKVSSEIQQLFPKY